VTGEKGTGCDKGTGGVEEAEKGREGRKEVVGEEGREEVRGSLGRTEGAGRSEAVGEKGR